MRQFLQLTLDLFQDVVAPSKKEEKEPSARIGIDDLATKNIALAEQLLVLPHAPSEPLSQVLRPMTFAHPLASREVRLVTRERMAAGKAARDEGYGESIVAYEFRRVKRKTIGFSVNADGLTVSAPRWVPLPEVDKALQEKAGWILKKLHESREQRARLEASRIEWRDGTLVPFLGEQVIVVIDPRMAYGSSNAGNGAGAQLHSAAETLPGVPRLTLHIGLPQDAAPERIRDAVQAWLMRQAKRVFEERLNHYAPLLGVRWVKLALSSAGTRWGSAGSNGHIRLNWRLIHFRASVIDYVVVHELAHLRVMDHSPRFWSTVESVMPDYEARKGQLREEAIPAWN
jgi:predicted metal-dependent hydrolase